jgi:uncharacterized damage-inducible protein DinB
MIDPAYVRTFARYNAWQNASCYREAARLSDEERRKDRGVFFNSIHGTLSHILFGDQIWMHRFTGSPRPRAASIAESPNAYSSFGELSRERAAFDQALIAWADQLNTAQLSGDLTWRSPAMEREITRPRVLLVAHMFNHQTHHRGQVHAMLTAAGARPDDTDLPFMPGL